MGRLMMVAVAALVLVSVAVAGRTSYTLTESKREGSGLIGFRVDVDPAPVVPSPIVPGSVWVRNRCWAGGTLVRDEKMAAANVFDADGEFVMVEGWPFHADGDACEAYAYLYRGGSTKPAGPVLSYTP